MKRLRLVHRAAARLLRLSLAFSSPLLAALAIAGLSWPRNRSGTATFLAIYKDQFEEDVALLSQVAPEIGLRPISLYFFKQIFRSVAGRSLRGMTESNYYSSGDWDQAKRRYRRFLAPTLRHLRRLIGLRGIISCNFNYIAQQELAEACREIGLPLFVILKEGMIVPERQADWYRYYPGSYFSGRIAAQAVFTPNAYVARWISEAPFIETNAQLIPAGIPRTDAYKTSRIRERHGNSLLVFAFDPIFSFRYFSEMYPTPADPALPQRLREHTRLLYRTILEFAASHPNVPVVIKTKPRSLVEKAIQPIVDELRSHHNGIPNLVVTNSGHAIDLIAEARVVIALNSTTVAEALLARRRVLTPDFSEFFLGSAWHYFHQFPSLLQTVRTLEELEAAMARDDELPEAEAKAFVERQLAFDDRLASEAVAGDIKRMAVSDALQ